MPRKIEIDIDAFGRGTILLDGEPVKDARSVTIRAFVDEPVSVEIEYIGVAVDATIEDPIVTTSGSIAGTTVYCEACGLTSDTPFSTSVDGAHRREGAKEWCSKPLAPHAPPFVTARKPMKRDA